MVAPEEPQTTETTETAQPLWHMALSVLLAVTKATEKGVQLQNPDKFVHDITGLDWEIVHEARVRAGAHYLDRDMQNRATVRQDSEFALRLAAATSFATTKGEAVPRDGLMIAVGRQLMADIVYGSVEPIR